MLTGKTKRGVNTRSLLGVKRADTPTTWIVVCDRSQARIFKANGKGKELSLEQKIAHPAGRKKGRELVGDKPGRSFDSHTLSKKGQTGGSRHALAPKTTPEEHETEIFAKNLADTIEKGRKGKTFNALVLVAESKLLGCVKGYLKPATLNIAKIHEKDLAWLSGKDLQSRLSQLV